MHDFFSGVDELSFTRVSFKESMLVMLEYMVILKVVHSMVEDYVFK